MPTQTVSFRQVHVERAPEDAARAVEIIMHAGPRPLLFLLDQHSWERQVAVITQARAASMDNTVLFHKSQLSPLGLTALQEMATALQEQLSAAQLLAACQELENSIACFALVKSLGKLSAANPSVWQHMLSWLPSTTFIARARGEVFSSKAVQENAQVFTPYRGWVQMSAPTPRTSATAALESVTQLAQPVASFTREVPPSAYWGTPVITEWCYAPADLGQVVSAVQSQSRQCMWCNEPYAASQCPTCSPTSLYGGPLS